MAHLCSLELKTKMAETLSTEDLSRVEESFRKLDQLDDAQKSALLTYVMDFGREQGVSQAGMEPLRKYYSRMVQVQKVEKQRENFFRHYETTHQDHPMSVRSKLRTLAANNAGFDLNKVYKMLPKTDPAAIISVLEGLDRTAPDAVENFISELEVYSPELTREAQRINDAPSALIKTLEDIEHHADTTMAMAKQQLEFLLQDPEFVKDFSSVDGMKEFVKDTFAYNGDGKFNGGYVAQKLLPVLSKLIAVANANGADMRVSPRNILSLDLLDPGRISVLDPDDFANIARGWVADDPLQALRDFGLEKDLEDILHLDSKQLELFVQTAAADNNSRLELAESRVRKHLTAMYHRLTESSLHDDADTELKHGEDDVATLLDSSPAVRDKAPVNVASRITGEMFAFPWKDSEAFEAARIQFMDGSLNHAMLDKVASLGKNVGLLEMYGPSPDSTYAILRQVALELARESGDVTGESFIKGKLIQGIADSTSSLTKAQTDKLKEELVLQDQWEALREKLRDAKDSDSQKAIRDQMNALQKQTEDLRDEVISTVNEQVEALQEQLLSEKDQGKRLKLHQEIKALNDSVAYMTLGGQSKFAATGLFKGLKRAALYVNPTYYHKMITGETDIVYDHALAGLAEKANVATSLMVLGASLFPSMVDIGARSVILRRLMPKTSLLNVQRGQAASTLGTLAFSRNSVLAGMGEVWESAWSMLSGTYDSVTGTYAKAPKTAAENINSVSSAASFMEKLGATFGFNYEQQYRVAQQMSLVFTYMPFATTSRVQAGGSFAGSEKISAFHNNFASSVFKSFGLAGLDASGRQQTALVTNSFLANVAELGLDKVDSMYLPGSRAVVERAGFTDADLAELRNFVDRTNDDSKILIVSSITDRDLLLKVAKFQNFYQKLATTAPGAKQRASLVEDTNPGTASGTIMRLMAMLKGFTMRFAQDTVPYLMDTESMGTTMGSKLGALAKYTATVMPWALVGLAMRDGLKEKETPLDEQLVRAFLYSGTAGIWADYALKEYTARNTLSGAVFGPTLSQADRFATSTSGVVHGEDKATSLRNITKQAVPFVSTPMTGILSPILNKVILSPLSGE